MTYPYAAHIPRKRFGQHFLHDSAIIQQIIQAIAPLCSDTLVEIGPGLGALTTQLLAQAKKLHVVEFDRDVIPKLKIACKNLGELIIHQADALKFDFATLANHQKKLRIVGNLPYNISTPLLFHLLEHADLIQDMFFMLQKEVVDRMAAKAHEAHYGRLSVMIQYYCKVEMLFSVNPDAFHPPPKVDSAVVHLEPHRTLPYIAKDVTLFATIVREAFNHRRKTLRNCLKSFIDAATLSSLGIDPIRRPEELSVEEYVNIANFLAG